MNNNPTENDEAFDPELEEGDDPWCVLLNPQTTVNVGNHYLVLGRGISNTDPNELSLDYIRGLSEDVVDFDAKMRIESGFYSRLAFVRGCTYYYEIEESLEEGYPNEMVSITGTMHVKAVLGCDYDRAAENNSLLKIRDQLCMGEVDAYEDDINPVNANRETLNVTVKSGNLHSSTPDTQIGERHECLYASISVTGDHLPVGRRVVHIEGGLLLSFAGGVDSPNPSDKESLYVRMTGGELRGSMYGAAAFAATSGDRRMIITGGAIRGWLAGGCNGTDPTKDGGVLPSDTYIYVGGNAEIGYSDGTTPPHINTSDGGNVFGAGSGNEAQPETGQVNNTNVAVADNAFVQNNVYGGGNYGFSSETASLFVTGGTVNGSVFGGSNQKTGNNVVITTTGGLVKGGIYGGSNITGVVSGYATLNLVGGQVGTSEQSANIHGGGMGASTQVDGNIDITLGDNNGHYPTVYGDVYGGSALGSVNGTTASSSKHTNVTVNNAQISGNVYGGGLGNSTVAANVYGLVTVNFKGGSADNVFGCNNVNGAPQCSPVTVNVDGGNVIHNIYGGANQASYTGNTIVNIGQAGSELQVNDVFGAGKGTSSDVTGTTNVTLYRGMVKGSIYGGAEEGTVSKNGADYTFKSTYVTMKDGTVKNNVYGGGKFGVTVGQTTVSIEGGRIENNVFGGAQGGDGCGILVAGLKTVNMKAGTILGDIYGGSENAVDANLLISGYDGFEGENGLYAQLDALTDAQDRQSTIFVNVYGGRVYQNIYGGGFMGRIYGSTTVNIGKNAIDNAPDRAANVNKPTGTYAIVAPVHVSGSLYAGSDWGTFSAGSSFGDQNISGYSNIYVDGLDYDMQKNLTDN